MEYKSSDYYREQRRILRHQIDEKKSIIKDDDKVGRAMLTTLRENLMLLTRLQLISQLSEIQLKINGIQRSKRQLAGALQMTLVDQLVTDNPIKPLWLEEIALFKDLRDCQVCLGICDKFIELGRGS